MRVYSAVRPTRRIWSFRFGWGIFPVGCSVGSSRVVQNGPRLPGVMPLFT